MKNPTPSGRSLAQEGWFDGCAGLSASMRKGGNLEPRPFRVYGLGLCKSGSALGAFFGEFGDFRGGLSLSDIKERFQRSWVWEVM